MHSVRQRVINIIAEQFGMEDFEKEDLKDGIRFKQDLGADSLDALEMIIELEDEFDLDISDEAAERFTTVGQVITSIEDAILAHAAEPRS